MSAGTRTTTTRPTTSTRRCARVRELGGTRRGQVAGTDARLVRGLHRQRGQRVQPLASRQLRRLSAPVANRSRSSRERAAAWGGRRRSGSRATATPSWSPRSTRSARRASRARSATPPAVRGRRQRVGAGRRAARGDARALRAARRHGRQRGRPARRAFPGARRGDLGAGARGQPQGRVPVRAGRRARRWSPAVTRARSSTWRAPTPRSRRARRRPTARPRAACAC